MYGKHPGEFRGCWTEPEVLRVSIAGRFGYEWISRAVQVSNGPNPGRTTPRVAVADDHAGVLRELCALLAPEFEVLTATTGEELLCTVERQRPDCVVTDVRMPGMGGLEAALQIVRRGLCDAVVLISVARDPTADLALRSGVRGFVLKVDAGEELIPALRAALAGEYYESRSARAPGFTPSFF